MSKAAAPAQKDVIGNFMQSVKAMGTKGEQPAEAPPAAPAVPEVPTVPATPTPAAPVAPAAAPEAPAAADEDDKGGTEEQEAPAEAKGEDKEAAALIADIAAGSPDAPAKLTAYVGKQVHAATEGIIASIPGIVQNLVASKVSDVNKYNEFFDKNKDLVPHRELVHAMAPVIAGKHPGKSVDEHLGLLADEVRKTVNPAKKASLPANPGAGGGGDDGQVPGALTPEQMQKKMMADVVKGKRR